MAYQRDRLFRICTPGSELDVPEFQELLVAYGQAMWSWARCENKLFIIFAYAMSGNHPDVPALREMFFSVVSPQARIDMIHAIAKVRWKKSEVWDDWVTLYDDLKKQLAVRGRMSHLVGHAYYPKPKCKKAVVVLMAPTWHPKSPITHADANASEFNLKSLFIYTRTWELLSSQLGVFVALAEHLAKPGAGLLSAIHLRQLLQRPIVRTNAKPQHQRKPSGGKS